MRKPCRATKLHILLHITTTYSRKLNEQFAKRRVGVLQDTCLTDLRDSINRVNRVEVSFRIPNNWRGARGVTRAQV